MCLFVCLCVCLLLRFVGVFCWFLLYFLCVSVQTLIMVIFMQIGRFSSGVFHHHSLTFIFLIYVCND